jgi:hypothetical protein
MNLTRKILIIIACVLIVVTTLSLGLTLGYFSDSENSVDNILRFKDSW